MTRLEWKINNWKKHCGWNLYLLKKPLVIIATITLIVTITPIVYAESAKNIEEENIKKQEAIEKAERLRIEKEKQDEMERQKKEQEEYEKARKEKELKEQHENSVYYFKKEFKVGDRIKILDMNYLIPEGDTYRFSIGDIDVIQSIDYEHLTMQGESGNMWFYDGFTQKVRSNREWRDLVIMKDRNQLGFYEENENE